MRKVEAHASLVITLASYRTLFFPKLSFSNFLQNIGPINGSKKVISKTALDAATEILAYDESADSNSHGKMTAKISSKEGSTKQESELSTEDFDAPLSTGAIKRMLELLCDESVKSPHFLLCSVCL